MGCTPGSFPRRSIVGRVLKIWNRRNVLALRRVDLGFVDDVLGDDVGRGRPVTYRSQTKLRALLFGWSFRERFMTRIARLAGSVLGRVACLLRDKGPSHDVLTDFFHVLAARIEDVFRRLVERLVSAGVLGRARAIDTTLVRAYKNDTSARSNWDARWNRWAAGYSLLVVSDQETHAVLAARVRPTMSVPASLAVDVCEEVRRRCGMDVLLGDSEFDTLALDAWCRDHDVLPVVLRNRRRFGKATDTKYRVQEWRGLRQRVLDRWYRKRVAVEQLFKGLKVDLGLEDVRLKGLDRVRVHAFLVVLWRDLQVLEAWRRHGNMRGTSN